MLHINKDNSILRNTLQYVYYRNNIINIIMIVYVLEIAYIR